MGTVNDHTDAHRYNTTYLGMIYEDLDVWSLNPWIACVRSSNHRHITEASPGNYYLSEVIHKVTNLSFDPVP